MSSESKPLKRQPAPAQRVRGRLRMSRASARRRPRRSSSVYRKQAQHHLRRFRRASTLAVALTAVVLFLSSSNHTGAAAEIQSVEAPQTIQDSSTVGQVQQAARPLRDLANTAKRTLPRIGVAILILVVAGILARVVRPVLRRILHAWESADAAAAMVVLGIWILAVGAAISVIAGDVRALVGSVGLFGLALSWSLQTPIESFTGWMLNSFRGYYRVGDRIAVGSVFGDVYAIDILTTTVWEAGGADKAVTAAQPTGALITFPNSEVLHANIINYTRDFPYVWDEVTIGVANETELDYAIGVFGLTARALLSDTMSAPAENYRALLRDKALPYDVALEPQVFVTLRDAWVDLTVRYLVPARERRTWSTNLILALARASAAPEHKDRIKPAYPRQQLELLNAHQSP